MNTLGVILSACCLATSLIELRMRSDLAGRRMAAVLAATAWLTMGLIAWDQAKKCEKLQRQQHTSTPTQQILAQYPRDQWEYQQTDGSVIRFRAGASPEFHLTGGNPWPAKPSERW